MSQKIGLLAHILFLEKNRKYEWLIYLLEMIHKGSKTVHEGGEIDE